jgi:hypothetical protein
MQPSILYAVKHIGASSPAWLQQCKTAVWTFPPCEEILVSGIAGYFPYLETVYQF